MLGQHFTIELHSQSYHFDLDGIKSGHLFFCTCMRACRGEDNLVLELDLKLSGLCVKCFYPVNYLAGPGFQTYLLSKSCVLED